MSCNYLRKESETFPIEKSGVCSFDVCHFDGYQVCRCHFDICQIEISKLSKDC